MARKAWIVAASLLVMGGGAELEAQSWQQSEEGWCDQDWGGRDQERSCHVLSSDLADPGELVIDGGVNGGVSIEGWNGSDIEVRAKVWANARSESRAEEIAQAVDVRWSGGRLSAEGPDTGRRESWGVSWDVRVPVDTDLDIQTHNGGISVDGVAGRIQFEALNGGVQLTGVAGDVEGTTTNGGLHVRLNGDSWNGAGLDVETVNGGVTMEVPRGYSAHLETGTVNGGIDVDFPVTVQGRIGRSLNIDLGEGGRTVRARTTNGGVKIVRSGATPVR